MLKRIFAVFAVTLILTALVSCGGKKTVAKLDAEDTFARGMEYFNKKKYVDAIDDFKEIIYNYAGTRVAAEASYYLGECYLKTKDYESAIEEYQHLTSDYSSSPFAEKGLYRMAFTYYKMSPHYALDQTETTDKAKSTLQLFFERYSEGPVLKEAEDLLLQVNEKLAHKDYESGIIYYKMKQYSSAKIYLEGVARDYKNTPWAKKSQIMLEQIESILSKQKPEKTAFIADSTDKNNIQ